jgi:anaerobic magnesium-protoporphyrin IX monomethyl ester cyclase
MIQNAKPVDIVLIYPHVPPEMRPWRKLWLFPPLGLSYLQAALKSHGFRVKTLDTTFRGIASVVEEAKALRPKMIGLSVMWTMQDAALEILSQLKGCGAILVAGGPFPTMDPNYFIKHVDFVFRGEGEVAFPAIVKKIMANDESYRTMPGVWYKDGDKIIDNGKPEFIADLDTVPHADRSAFDDATYQSYWKKTFGYTLTPVLTTRGCPYRCDFCSKPVFGQRYRERSPEHVAEEFEMISAAGFERIWVADDVFTLKLKRTHEVCEAIWKKHLPVVWECLSRVEGADESLFRHMRRAGCVRVFFGLESGDDEVVKKLVKKLHTTKQARSGVELARQAGIEVGSFFLLGYPGESRETVKKTLRFAADLPLDYASFTVPVPLPGTGLHDRIGRDPNKVWKRTHENSVLFESDLGGRFLKLATMAGALQQKMKRFMGDTAWGVVGDYVQDVRDKALDLLAPPGDTKKTAEVIVQATPNM